MMGYANKGIKLLPYYYNAPIPLYDKNMH